jgi:hypothetical protein
VTVDLDFAIDLHDPAIFPKDEGRPLDPLEDFSVHILVFDHSVLFTYRAVGVAQERKRELILLPELKLGFDGVLADAEDDGFPRVERDDFIPEIACLARSARRVSLGVEEQDDLFARVRLQRYSFARIGFQRERRCFLSLFKHNNLLR